MGSLIQELEWGKRNSMLEDKDFELLDEETPVNENIVEEDEVITEDDFKLTQVDETVHEQKFQTKPTTFLKDSLKRFRKNKSSVVAAYILGALLILSFAVPLFDTSNTKVARPYEVYLAPKLFKSGTGFWDGSIKYKNIAVDLSEMPEATTEEEKQEHWWPSSKQFPQRSAISKKKFTEEKYCNDISNLGSFGKEGYVHFGYYENREAGDIVAFSSKTIPSLDLNETLYLTSFDTYDVEKIRMMEGKNNLGAPDDYHIGESAFYFLYTEPMINPETGEPTGENEEKEVKLVDYAERHNIGSSVESLKEDKVDIASIIKAETGKTTFDNASFSVRMIAQGHGKRVCSLIRSITFESETTNESIATAFNDMSFTDATSVITKSIKDGYKYWSSTGIRRIYLSKAYFCSFVYDTYEAAFGERVIDGEYVSVLLTYQDLGWVSFKDQDGWDTIWQDDYGYWIDDVNFHCEILNPEKCPLSRPLELSDFYGYLEQPGTLGVKMHVQYYKYLGYTRIPQYLMGTDKSGRDMLKYVFEGLRTSLLLGVLTFAVCFTFGLIWGSICGYFGGTVDLVMERFTDILSGIPWIVVMTLIILHFGSNFWTFALALCMTGWIGTAARTRTQFYRFRGREYVLASRTLGASDARLIAKHILPNALGTIITGAVLMIPSVIFSEATISYLGLGLKDTSSLGVILSDNQGELLTSPYLLIFPSIVIALIMISFNLFGNGLRDAINPSLKGED